MNLSQKKSIINVVVPTLNSSVIFLTQNKEIHTSQQRIEKYAMNCHPLLQNDEIHGFSNHCKLSALIFRAILRLNSGGNRQKVGIRYYIKLKTVKITAL